MNSPAKTAFLTVALLLLAILAGCAAKVTAPPVVRSYVVLLRDQDGKVGQVSVRGTQGEQVLTEDLNGVALDGKTAPFLVTQEQLKRDFGAAMGALPNVPVEQAPLLFPSGVFSVTPELQKQVANIATLVLRLTQTGRSVDLSVVGHSDSIGSPDVKEKAGRERAQNVANELVRLGVPREAIWVEAHGDRQMFNPPRPPGGEPEHRRVVITIR